MRGGPEADDLAFEAATVDAADIVFDVVALPVETPLVRYGRERGKRVISGHEVLVRQGLEQFVLYTGVRPERELVERAAAQARA